MDYSRPNLADRLAAEYVLGTLRGPARRRFESLLIAHPTLRDAVSAWQARLEPLSTGIPEVPPPDRVWARIESELFADPVRVATPWWQRLGPWRAFSGLVTTALVGLLVVGLPREPSPPPMIIVLAANPEAAQALQARFVASVSGDGTALVLRPLDAVSLEPGRALELWSVPAQGAPRSLGLVQASGATTLVKGSALSNTAALAVSLEPAGGSPTGSPTGPIVSMGKLQL